MITRHASLPPALRFALRELRGGLKGFRIFIACLVLGVAAIAAVGTLTRAIEAGLKDQGRAILGGDLEVRLFQQRAPKDFIAWARSVGELSTSTRFRTMARIEDGSGATLVELRGVDDLYPLYGDFRTRPAMDHESLLAPRKGAWGLAVDPLLADRLDVALGDRLVFGGITAEIRAFIENEPDKANLGFQLGPSVMIRQDAVAKTGLETTGSLINHYYKLKLGPDTTLKAARETLKERWPDAGWRVRDFQNAAPGLRRFIDRMGTFLTLVGLAALVVGGVGVGNAVRGYMDRKTRTIATLKILGASGGTVFTTYFSQVLLIAVGAIAVGLALGAALPFFLGDLLPASIPVTPKASLYPGVMALAAIYGLLITVAFTAWPLGKARDLPPVRLFRAIVAPETKAPRPLYLALIGGAAAVVTALAIGLADNWKLAGGFMLGAAGALMLLRLTSWLIERGAAHAPRPKGALTRLAVANLHRPGAATGAVVISLGLGLTLFAALALIEGNLRGQLSEQVPSEAPAFFILDIQPEEKTPFEETARDIRGVEDVVTVPSLRARVVAVNGVPAEDAEVADSHKWVLRGDRGISYQAELGAGSRVVEGEWWPQGYDGPPQISMDTEAAEAMGLTIGDTITLSVLGREITAEIRSFRQIDWGSFGFNFVFLFDPHTLKAAPHTYMATLKADGPAEQRAHRILTSRFDSITAIRMKEVLSTVNGLLTQIGAAVRATALVAIVAGVLVLAGAIAAGFRQRVYESVIMKVVGAVRRQILQAYLLEYALIGLITALIALSLGGLAGYVVVTAVWDMDFAFLPVPMAITVGVSLLVTVGFGLLSSWQALSVKPGRVLRDE
ncbi:ABC transporter permease [Yunchengibacter salinarum]|uniref:ABC transporter permease n=1 Tax=Yunchengibacter salinarum TaxID=3133399 RepID=UPI0035B64F3B